MNKIEFELIQVAIGNRNSLSVRVEDADWQRLFDFCERQGLTGIGCSAVEKLHEQGTECPVALRRQWGTLAARIEQQNEQLNRLCVELVRQYAHDGLATCILQGQGCLLNYPAGLRQRRMPGDLDVWCVPPSSGVAIAVQTGSNEVEYVNYTGRRAVIEYVLQQHRIEGSTDRPVRKYHLIEAPAMDGTKVNVHYRVGRRCSPLRNWRMQRWFKAHLEECMQHSTQLGFAVPTASVGVVVQLVQLYYSAAEGGIRLCHLMDAYFALRAWQDEVTNRKNRQSQGMWSEGLGVPVLSPAEIRTVLRSFGMGQSVAAVMYVLREVFALPIPYCICEPNEREGRRLLADILQREGAGKPTC